MEISLYNGKVMITNNMSLTEAKALLDSYGFAVTNTDTSVIYHGESKLDDAEKIVVHLYFESTTKKIQAAVIHIFPINFTHIQNYLIFHYGKPAIRKSESEFIWIFNDCEMTHSIHDRFGDEEGIYFLFN